MEGVLWHVLSGTPGGSNRVRVLQALDERPRNANKLADDLDLNYKTVRHHLDILQQKDVVTSSEHDYGAVYCLTDRTRSHWETVETVIEQAENPTRHPPR